MKYDNLQHYFNLIQPYNHHTNIPSYGINCYSFALFPEEHQPSGTCNFTKIKNKLLDLAINSEMFTYKLSDIDPDSTDDTPIVTDVNVYLYSIKYQVLRIINGMCAFAFY